jgi:antitoxin (DNA-binding transcriptional repressor) of toxin-antitoxin stability system
MTDVSIAEAKSSFSELVSRTAAGERFVIRRRGRVVATLVNPDELERLERNANMAYRLALALGQDAALLEKVKRGDAHPAMAAFGLWDADEFANLTDEIYAERESSPSRSPVDL